jgi:DNA-binding CsgD family transcriptional regulator
VNEDGRYGPAIVEPPRIGTSLTPREVEILSLIADGLTYEEIGARLGIGIETARTHLAKARDRLGAQSRAGAVAKAFRLGLIQ